MYKRLPSNNNQREKTPLTPYNHNLHKTQLFGQVLPDHLQDTFKGMVKIRELETSESSEVDKIIKNSNSIQQYIHNDSQTPVTSAFYLTEKIMQDIGRNPQTEAAMNMNMHIQERVKRSQNHSS